MSLLTVDGRGTIEKGLYEVEKKRKKVFVSSLSIRCVQVLQFIIHL